MTWSGQDGQPTARDLDLRPVLEAGRPDPPVGIDRAHLTPGTFGQNRRAFGVVEVMMGEQDDRDLAPAGVQDRLQMILDLRPAVYAPLDGADASVDELISAYAARFDVTELEQIFFLRREEDGRLTFPDEEPATAADRRMQLLIARLRSDGPAPPAVGQILDTDGCLDGMSIPTLQGALADLYGRLAAEIVDDVRWLGVVVESCPTSNVMAGGIRGLARHPMRELIEAGILTTVNSDDPSLFHSWVPDELAHAEGGMEVPTGQLERSRELSLRIVAPGLAADEILDQLDAALLGLENPVVED